MNPGLARLLGKAITKGGQKAVGFIKDTIYASRYGNPTKISFRPTTRKSFKESEKQKKQWMTDTQPNTRGKKTINISTIRSTEDNLKIPAYLRKNNQTINDLGKVRGVNEFGASGRFSKWKSWQKELELINGKKFKKN